jgi:hypothetical protein
VIKLSPLSFKIFKKYKHFFIVCHQPKFDSTIPCQKYQQNHHVDWQRASLRIRLAKSTAVYAPDMNSHGFWERIVAYEIQEYKNQNLYENWQMSHAPFITRDWRIDPLEWLLTPYTRSRRHQLTRDEKHHNFCLSSERVAIENAFGLLKGRWRILQFINVYSLKKAVKITVACCALHNFCLLNDDVCQDYNENSDSEEDDDHIDHGRPMDRNRGAQKREQIKMLLRN